MARTPRSSKQQVGLPRAEVAVSVVLRAISGRLCIGRLANGIGSKNLHAGPGASKTLLTQNKSGTEMAAIVFKTMHSRKRRRKSCAVDIRPARPADLDALVELEQRVFAFDRLSRASLRHLIRSRTASVLLAVAGSDLAGAAVVLFRARSRVARLYSIGVVPRMSGRGVAAALLAVVDAVASGRRCRCVRLEVHERNAAAIARYRKSGFQQFGRHISYYEDGGNALRFEKVLARSRPRPRA